MGQQSTKTNLRFGQYSNIYPNSTIKVMDIDLKNVGLVGNGYVTCLSVYSGPDFDYGLNDQGPGTMLWVDNLDTNGNRTPII